MPGASPDVFNIHEVPYAYARLCDQEEPPGESSRNRYCGEPHPVAEAVNVTDVPAACGAATLGVRSVDVHGGPGCAAWPLSGSIIRDDSSTASNAEAGIVFSCDTMVAYGSTSQPASIVPWKYQFDPLSATIMP